MRLTRPQFTPVRAGKHRHIPQYRKWRIVEIVILIAFALFVYWAYRQRVPF